MKYKTEQENFWAGDFGDKYISRNVGEKLLASKINMFSKILTNCCKIESAIEFGSNVGMNLQTLAILIPEIQRTAVEINKNACEKMSELSIEEIYNKSILEFETDKKYDLAFTIGVLIHINPEELGTVYEKLYNCSKKYILVAEYYNPSPVEIEYRGHEKKLFKRDFAGELLNKYTDLKLVDYGFVYHRDNNFPDDDITWFLLEKK